MMKNSVTSRVVASFPGRLAIGSWVVYSALLIFHSRDAPPWVIISAVLGLVTCLVVAVSHRSWRIALLLSSSVYLTFYAFRVLRFAVSVQSSDESLLSALGFYYVGSWQVTSFSFRERGVFEGLTHAFVEYAMPLLMVLLIGATLSAWTRDSSRSSSLHAF